MNDLPAMILLLICGFVLGFVVCVSMVDKDFNGEYSKAVYEWKFNKEKQNDK